MVEKKKKSKAKTVYVVSGGTGAIGIQTVATVVAQFPNIEIPINRITHIRQKKQIKEIVAKASKSKGTIVHTLVNTDLRNTLVELARKQNVAAFDLMGSLQDHLAETTGHEPVGKPGLYRKRHYDYFERIEALEFAINHDDGQNVQDLSSAEVVLTGVSRSGKSPLTMYLAVHGWKAANVPLVKEVPPPKKLFEVDRRRVIGLSIAYEQLFLHRRKRQADMGVDGQSIYSDRLAVSEELAFARKIYKKGRFHVIDVNDKPIETTAREIIEHLTITFKGKPHKK